MLIAAALSFLAVSGCRGARPVDTRAAATAAAPAHESKAFTGTVAETMNGGGYTYARLQDGSTEIWIAASQFDTKAGDRLTVPLEMPMKNFESRSLGRTFPSIYFVSRVGRDGELPRAAAASPSTLAPGHAGGAAAASTPTAVEPIAPPPGAMSIADVWSRRTSLAGREVTVKGKVVKVNEQIMGRNWIHLQDGSGSAADRTNDLTVTTADSVTNGDVIVVKGVLAADKDFGAGYAYGAILEKATVIR